MFCRGFFFFCGYYFVHNSLQTRPYPSYFVFNANSKIILYTGFIVYCLHYITPMKWVYIFSYYVIIGCGICTYVGVRQSRVSLIHCWPLVVREMEGIYLYSLEEGGGEPYVNGMHAWLGSGLLCSFSRTGQALSWRLKIPFSISKLNQSSKTLLKRQLKRYLNTTWNHLWISRLVHEMTLRQSTVNSVKPWKGSSLSDTKTLKPPL